MGNTKAEKATWLLSKGIQETLVNITADAPDSSLKLLNIFNITGLDYKGQLTSGFGDRGFGVGGGVSVNFGDLILPGLVETKAGVKLRGKSTHYSMVLLQRFPRLYFHLSGDADQYFQETDDKKGKTESGIPLVWKTSQPVCLLHLDGNSKTIEAGVNVSLGVGLDASVGELGLKVKASASAEASIQGRLMRLTCPQPEFFSEASASDLYSRVFEILSVSLPVVVQDWLTTVLAPDQEEDSLREALTKDFKKVADDLMKQWTGGLPKLPEGMKIGEIQKAVGSKKPDVQDLLKALDELYKLLSLKIQNLMKSAGQAHAREIADLDQTLDQARAQQQQISIFKRDLENLDTPAVVKKWMETVMESKDLRELPVMKDSQALKKVLEEAKPAIDELMEGLNQLNRLLNSGIGEAGQKSSSTARIEELQRFLNKIPIYKQELGRIRSKKEKRKSSQPTGKQPIPLPQLQLAVVTGQAGAEAKAEASLSLEIAGASAKGQAEASAGIQGHANLISYRFQSYGAGDLGNLIMTQDTTITYRQVEVSAALKADLGLELPTSPKHPYKKDLENESEPEESEPEEDDGSEEEGDDNDDKENGAKKEWHYRTMTYRSAIAYWQVPATAKEKNAFEKIAISGEGSGLILGSSVQLDRLTELVTSLKQEAPADKLKPNLEKLLRNLSNSLHLPQPVLRKFLKGATGLIDADPAQFKTDCLLLEAGFAFPKGVSSSGGEVSTTVHLLNVKKNKNGWVLGNLIEDDQVKGFLQAPPPADGDFLKVPSEEDFILEVIRLRYRLSDRWDEGDTLFKLGFSRMLGLELKVDRFRDAGHEGVIDLAAWFANEKLNTNAKEGYERSIPPVALLHN